MGMRYVKQRKLDIFRHFLVSAAFVFKPTAVIFPFGMTEPVEDPIGDPKHDSDNDFEEK